MNISPLAFSTSFCESILLSDVENFNIEKDSIIINASEDAAKINDELCPPWRSLICNAGQVSGKKVIVLSPKTQMHDISKFKYSDEVESSWSHVFDVFNVNSLKDVNLWRSKKDKSISGVELNLWYAPEGTDCGIHNEHNFREIHTQVSGLGIMQKFNESKYDSLYREVLMPVGFTHDPFYDKNLSYPWHQYKCITDCIWLAIEFYD